MLVAARHCFLTSAACTQVSTLVAGFFPLMTTLSKREVNSRLAIGVKVRVAANLIAGV